MKDLTFKSRFYIVCTIILGISLIGWSLFNLDWGKLGMVLALSAVSSLSLVLKVEGSTERSHYNISFLLYAFALLLLGPEATVVVILLSNLVDWAWHQYPWYIQSFNISNYAIAIHLANLVYLWTNPAATFFSFQGVLGIASAMAVFTLFNHLLVGMVIWLARGENFVKSGVFGFFPLMLDFTLLCMGAGSALIWLLNPFAIVLVLLPLYLIYNTLKVPALERQSETDPKTGLYNARFFEHALQSELNRANRFDRPLTVVMSDLDLLRNINNTYGHLAGDEVLIGIAKILQNSLREYDIVARFGGEEYAILMPETTPQEAYPRIEAIRESIEKAEFSVPTSVTPIKATMSFGIAGREGFNQEPTDIVHSADAALYHSKIKGRNRVYAYTDEGFENLFGLSEATKLKKARDEGSTTSDDIFNKDRHIDSKQYQKPVSSDIDASEEKQEPLKLSKSKPRWAVNAYIGILTVIALVLFALIYEPPLYLDWMELLVFVLLVVLTEWFSIDIYVRNTAISTSAAPMLAGILLYGSFGALILSLTFAAVALFKHRSPVNRFIFNASNQLIAGALYLGMLVLAGLNFVDLETGMQLLLCLVSAGIVYFSTTLLVSLGMSFDLGQPTREIWIEHYSWLAAYYGGMGILAFALTFSYQVAGWVGSAVILIPLLLLRLSQKQYIDKTRTVVNQLRDKNFALERSSEEIGKLSEGLLDTLAEVVDLRDPHVLGHSRQVARYAIIMARSLGLHPKQVELVRKAGLLHDIGKLGISEAILFKPGPLNPQEYSLVREHATLGAEILENSHSLNQLIPIIRYHHERYDGNGYPEGLKGGDIPLEARILCVADAVEAMASDRPYRSAMTMTEIIEELNTNSGTQFDPQVVRAFVHASQMEGDAFVINSARKPFGDNHLGRDNYTHGSFRTV